MGSNSYTADDLSVLKGLDAVRKRPGMYIGSTSSRGLRHLLWEIADNSVDEALAGHGNRIDIKIADNGMVTVADHGRGMPVDIEKSTGLPGVVVIFTELHAGGKFGGGAYGSAGGLHGVGASVVNALSKRVDVQVRRDGKVHEISFDHGVPGHFDGDKFTPSSKPRSTPAKTKGTGTTVSFLPDTKIFEKDARIDVDEVLARARQTAFLVPGLKLTVTAPGVKEEFSFDGGTADFVDHLSPTPAVSPTLLARGTGDYVETVPVLDQATGQLRSTEVSRTMEVDIALRWNEGYAGTVSSFVNVVATPKGGTHVSGFERSLSKMINEQLRSFKVAKASEENVTKDDVLEGLTAVILVRIAEPQFEGQTKEILGTPAASKIVAEVVTSSLKAFFDAPKNKADAKKILEKVRAAAQARLSARAHRDTVRRKNAVESASMPAKLKDCRSHDLDDSELFLIEGDSAGGTASSARDSATQALLPLRGKVLNTLRASEKDMLKNAECVAMITAIGGGYGKAFDLDSIRYGKLVLMADADPDGDHIRLLLLTFLWKYMRPLIEAGRVYAAVPPLFQVDVSGRTKETFYATDVDGRNEILKSLREKGIADNRIDVKRLKGLGEQDADTLAETTMAKETRTLRRVELRDAEEAAKWVEDLMGDKVPPRLEFLTNSARNLDRQELDLSA